MSRGHTFTGITNITREDTMKYKALLETRQNGKTIKESSQEFDNQLQAEAWLGSANREARELKVKVTDHYLIKVS